tara:strand:+ start:5062 stop:6348 length:1287 start_codon:yes stop_codon:yes gene_type:complete
MSATIIHHGHIRLLEKASQYGDVIVGLTTDDEIQDKKGYVPELAYHQREQILKSIKWVFDVVPTPWLIDNSTLDKYNIDSLIHGDDNSNDVSKDRLIILPRTKGISSSEIRQKSFKAIINKNNRKLMLTPGPATVLYENLENIKPIFGRGDIDYDEMMSEVINWVKKLSGQDRIVFMQGSSTLSLELAAHSFVRGKVLLISTGYYSDRLELLLPVNCEVTKCKYEDLDLVNGKYDWILCAYTETSTAFKVDLSKIKAKANDISAKLYLDATGSIGLEEDHGLADLMAFSSCKGLFGLTGASFIAYKDDLSINNTDLFYFNIETQRKKMVTGPYHSIASLYGIIGIHDDLKERVANSKRLVMSEWEDLTRGPSNQPFLCTYLEGEVVPLDERIVLYSPRSELNGSVVCHFGEIHSDRILLNERIRVNKC